MIPVPWTKVRGFIYCLVNLIWNPILQFATWKISKISGRICSVGTVFLREFQVLDEGFKFYRISDILVSLEHILFVMEIMETCYFCADRFGFVVLPTKIFLVIRRLIGQENSLARQCWTKNVENSRSSSVAGLLLPDLFQLRLFYLDK